ncbi:MAG: hypothetical protein HUU29_08865, partial [Planctomycetaceae bacterium]|nr:hypothetical protein [Planctomycetaceae bacterium]
EDERLIRGYGFWRDFHQSRTLNTVGDAAGMLLGKIIKDDLGEEVDSALFYPGHRDDFVKWLEPHLAAHRRNRMLWWGSITAVGIAVVILYWRRGVVRRKREGSQPPQPEKT